MDWDTIFALVLYILTCYANAKIGEKFKIGTTAGYFIPFYGMVLFCRCAGISGWWVVGLCIPLVNIAVIVYTYGSVEGRLGKSFWAYGLGSLFLLPTIVLAFDDAQPVV